MLCRVVNLDEWGAMASHRGSPNLQDGDDRLGYCDLDEGVISKPPPEAVYPVLAFAEKSDISGPMPLLVSVRMKSAFLCSGDCYPVCPLRRIG
jgi:hypothetical protein